MSALTTTPSVRAWRPRTLWHRVDFVQLLSVLALTALGMLMIYSAYETALPPDTPLMEHALFRQGLFFLIGLCLYAVGAAVDYDSLRALAPWLYVFVLLMLAITLTVGQTSFGAQSWLETDAPFDVQPSEPSKLLMIIVLARVLGVEGDELEGPLALLISMVLVAVPVVLIYLQPDFGTAVILASVWFGMVFLAGVRWRHLMVLGMLAAGLAPVVWFRAPDYMRRRVLLFLVPGADLTGASYNVRQALISIGSGGWFGKGLLQGTQSQLYFLRVRHTDFVFSVLAEELGFAGSVLLLGLFGWLILRLVGRAASMSDPFGRLIIGGVATMLATQTIINVGMNANLLPVTGLPLPLVSYGGSSLVTTLAALGLAQGICMRAKPEENSLLG